MATTIYDKLRIELVFWNTGAKASDGNSVLELAGFCFVKVADNKSFVMPTPTNIRITETGLKAFITKIHVYERKAAIPQQQGKDKIGCQFFGI